MRCIGIFSSVAGSSLPSIGRPNTSMARPSSHGVSAAGTIQEQAPSVMAGTTQPMSRIIQNRNLLGERTSGCCLEPGSKSVTDGGKL